MDVKQNLANNIANHRKALKLTQAEFANKLNYSDKAVSKWERGEAVPDLVVLKQIADFFGVTIDLLISEPRKAKPTYLKNLGKRRVVTSLLSTCIVWLIATLSYTFLGILIPTIEETWLSFIIAVPVTIIVLLVLTSVWGKNLFNFIFSSLLVWSLITAIFLVLFNALATPPQRLWYIYLVGIPVQLLLCFSFLYKKVNKAS